MNLPAASCGPRSEKMITVDEFREKLKLYETERILEEILLADDAKHVSPENIKRIRSSVASKFGVMEKSFDLWITGSAKRLRNDLSG